MVETDGSYDKASARSKMHEADVLMEKENRGLPSFVRASVKRK